MFRNDQAISIVALATLVAFVVVILAFFFTYPTREGFTHYGAPNGKEYIQIFNQEGPRTQPQAGLDQQPDQSDSGSRLLLRENGVPQKPVSN